MARPQTVTDQQMLQACTDLHSASKPVTVRGVHAMTGGDLKRIAKVVDDFKVQNGLDPLAAANQPHAVPTKLEDLPEELRKCVEDNRKAREQFDLDLAVIAQQAARNELEAERLACGTDAQAARNDRDYANHQHDLLAAAHRDLEEELQREREGRLQDQHAHPLALKQAQDQLAGQLEQIRRQFQQQMEETRRQADDAIAEERKRTAAAQQEYERMLEGKGYAEAAKAEAVRHAAELQNRLDTKATELGEAIVARARAEGSAVTLQAQLEASEAHVKRVDAALGSLQEQLRTVGQSIGRLTERADKMDAVANQIGGLHEQVAEVLEHVEAIMGQSGPRPAPDTSHARRAHATE